MVAPGAYLGKLFLVQTLNLFTDLIFFAKNITWCKQIIINWDFKVCQKDILLLIGFLNSNIAFSEDIY